MKKQSTRPVQDETYPASNMQCAGHRAHDPDNSVAASSEKQHNSREPRLEIAAKSTNDASEERDSRQNAPARAFAFADAAPMLKEPGASSFCSS